jgi:hypothetical protein
MFGAMGKYLKNKYDPQPHIEVDEAEFLRILVENGKTEENARFHLMISQGLGSAVAIGDKMYKVKGEDEESVAGEV